MSGNQLSEFGSGLSAMPSLQLLLLDHNRLKILPDSLGSCPSLLKLDISNNLLQRLPETMGQLKRIQRINCSNNSLEAVPHTMGYLPLREFDLRLKFEIHTISYDCHQIHRRRLDDCKYILNAIISRSRISGAYENLYYGLFLTWILSSIIAAHHHHVLRSAGKQLEAKRLPMWSRSNNLQPDYKERVTEGLSKLLAFLREKEQEHRQEELRKLIPVGIKVYLHEKHRLFRSSMTRLSQVSKILTSHLDLLEA